MLGYESRVKLQKGKKIVAGRVDDVSPVTI
jgi:hypothetical protein